jgi:pyrimidine-nucleoside phosphorylase
MTFHPQDLIRRKRDLQPLTDADLQAFVTAVTTQSGISEAQIGAFLMAVFHNGLTPSELAALTQAMRFSGETFDATPLKTFTVDKHSTGGVGDKTSLLIAPILAAAGLGHPTPAGLPGICVPMISGRSLGHTGGTLDKLETIPGFDTQLSLARFEQVLRECGAALIGQTPTLVPADRILYALRDHTSTVESPYLITASIMSKKLAESLNALVLDVKTGSGAFMKDPADARLLARLMVETGEAAGTRTVALITDHSQPLGRYAGNWLEIVECVDILRNHRHPISANLIELSLLLSGWMLHLAGHTPTPEAGITLADKYLTSGVAYTAFLRIVHAQGGDTSVFPEITAASNSSSFASEIGPGFSPDISGAEKAGASAPGICPLFPPGCKTPTHTTQFLAPTSGYIHAIDTIAVGWAVQRLGAGRLIPGGPVSALAGIEFHAQLGSPVTQGQPIATLHSESPTLLAEPLELLRAAYTIAPTPTALNPQLIEVIAKERVR